MANYFPGAKDFTINGGTFGEDYSRHTTYHGPVYRTNDHSTHRTNYGGYVNRGQHASGGAINNRGPQTTNNGPVYDYQQYTGSRGGKRRSPRPPSPPEEFDAHPFRPGQQNRPPQGPSFDTNPTYGHDDDDADFSSSDELEDEPDLPPPRRPQQRTVPTRPQAKRPGNHDDSLIEELKTLSPEMQRYIKSMQQRNRGPIPPVRPESELQDRMSDMQLDDAGPSRPPAGRGSPRVPGGPQNPKSSARTRGPRVAEPYRDNSPEDDSDSDEDGDPAPLHGRAIITSTDSNNVNSTTVVDSHNDNSTRTEITKAYGDR